MDDIIYKGYLRPMLKHIKDNYDIKESLVGVEIGVKAGHNAKFILENLPIKCLYLIDPYIKYKNIDVNYNPVDEKQNVINIINKYNNVNFIEKFSSDAINDIPNNLDFVYIDGNHYFNYVLEDIKNYYLKVKDNGYVGGHDYDIHRERNQVKKAVDTFVKKNNLTLFTGICDDPHSIKFKGLHDWWVIKP